LDCALPIVDRRVGTWKLAVDVTRDSTDALQMARALALAERGRGRTTPNPMVGAVVVDAEGVVVGRGAHEFAGGPHAEVRALRDAEGRARGATLYCTLEPCCHTGRTGPCAPEIVNAGITRVVVAIEDPNPRVSGGGIAHLRQHGIEVFVGVGREDAERLNRPFFTRITKRRPFVTMKAAVSLDGRIAAAKGVRTPLTGAAANRLIHRERAEVDAIAVGSETVLVDDPLLTARGPYRFRPLVRVVFDRRLRTPPTARLLSTPEVGPVIIITTPSAAEAGPDRVRALTSAGARVEPLRPPGTIRAALELLASEGVTSLIVEGGTSLHAAFWTAGLVDRVEMFVTPHDLGSAGVEWVPFPVLASGLVTAMSAVPVGEDVLIAAYVHRPD
jgi:diaminohydroxyphosphoribosylaminopyrimidine deaminase/5-amino-6-(5-phosphoribosylamino)uracil reductase